MSPFDSVEILLSFRNSPPADGAQSYTVKPACTFCFLSPASQRSPFSCRLNAFGIVWTFLQIDIICVHLRASQWGDPRPGLLSLANSELVWNLSRVNLLKMSPFLHVPWPAYGHRPYLTGKHVHTLAQTWILNCRGCLQRHYLFFLM